VRAGQGVRIHLVVRHDELFITPIASELQHRFHFILLYPSDPGLSSMEWAAWLEPGQIEIRLRSHNPSGGRFRRGSWGMS